jgi:hypothetical protein
MMDENTPVVFKLRVPILSVVPALVVTLVLAGAVWLVTGWSADATPVCPTEDSCSADYRPDRWHIDADTP